MFILTFRGCLVIIGEPERYLEYSVFFLCIVMYEIVSSTTYLSNNILMIIVMLQCCIILLNLIVSNDPRKLFTANVAIPSYTNEIMNFFSNEKIPKKKNIAVIPVKNAMPLSYALNSRGLTNLNFFYRHIEDGSPDFDYMHKSLGGNVNDPLGLRWGKKSNMKSSEVFSLSGEDLFDLFNITHVLIEANYRKRVNNRWLNELETKYKLVFSTHEVDVYRFIN